MFNSSLHDSNGWNTIRTAYRALSVLLLLSLVLSSCAPATRSTPTAPTPQPTPPTQQTGNYQPPVYNHPGARTGDDQAPLPGNAAGSANGALPSTQIPSQQDLQAYFWKQYLEAATGSPDGELWFKSDKVWFKSFKPAPNPVRKVHAGAGSRNGASSGFQLVSWHPSDDPGSVSLPRSASTAGIFTVTTLADTDDGTCDSDCSFREAIYAANDSPGADTITFSISGTIQLESALPYMTDPAGLTIDGSGEQVTIQGYGSNQTSGTISDVSFTTDSPAFQGSECDPYYSEGSLTISGATVSGCGIYSVGALTIVNSTLIDSPSYTESTLSISDSHLTNSSDYSDGMQTITNSDFSSSAIYSGTTLDLNNSSFADGPNYSGAAQTITSSTLTDSSSIYSGTTLDLSNSTFTDSPNYSGGAQTITSCRFTNSSIYSGTTLQIENGSLADSLNYSEGAQTVTGVGFLGDSNACSGATLHIEDSFFYSSSTCSTGAQTITDTNFSDSSIGSMGILTLTNGVFLRTSVFGDIAVTIHSNGTLAMVNSTFLGNANQDGISELTSDYRGVVPLGATSSFAGSFVSAKTSLTIESQDSLTSTNNTFAGSNIGSSTGLYLYNTILANGSSCGRSVSAGNNNLLESSGGCGLTNGVSGNLVGIEADLEPLTGSPAYFPLGAYSPAINAGDDTICSTEPVSYRSQNGLTRRTGDHCDIGAYESPVISNAETNSSGGDACLATTSEQAQGLAGGPINTRSGGYEYIVEDLSIPTSAGTLTFRRDYASLTVDSPTSLSPGWTHNHDTRLIFPDDAGGQAGTVLFKAHTANQYTFFDNDDGTYAAAPGLCATLVRDPGPPVRFIVTNAGGDTYTFDENGALLTYADAQGNSWNYIYDGAGHVTQVSADGDASTLVIGYDGAGRVASVSDQSGRSARYSYDAAGDLSTATDALGQDWSYSYDGDHRLTEVRDPAGNTVERTEFDAEGRAARQYDGSGNLVVGLTYNADRTTTIEDAQGNTETHAYDRRNALAADSDALGGTTSKTYDFNFRPAAITDPIGHTATLVWSGDGTDLNQVTDALGGQTRITYDSLHNPLSVTDPKNYLTTFTYSGKLLTSSTDALNGETTYTYTPEGFLESVTDPLGHTTSYTYDTHGQRTSMTDALGNAWHYAYDSLGRLTDTTDPVGRVTHSEYDAAGRMTRTIRNYDPNRPQNDQDQHNIVSEYEYDVRGNQTAVTDTYGNTTHYVYDEAGRLTQTIDPEGNTTTNTYNEAGQLMSVTDPNGNTTQYGYDAAGRQISVTDALGNTTHTAYNPDGSAASTTDALGRLTRYAYDALKRVVAVTDPEGGVTHSEYDADGNLIASTDPSGNTAHYGYDALGRLIRQTDPLSGVTETFYDAAGNRGQTIDPRGNATTYAYDDANRLVSVTDALGNVTSYEYDDLGRRAAVVDANGGRTTYTYDALDRVAAVTDPLGHTTYTAYDALGRTLTTTDANGNTTSFAYDALGRLTTVSNPPSGTSQSSVTSYQYDANGNRLSVTDPNGHTSQTDYDALNRALSQTDPLGNVTTTTYDAAGQVVSTTGADGKTTAFGYDALGRQVSVADPLGNSTSSDYDPAGNLVASTDADGVVTRYEYDGLNRLAAVVENYRPGLQPTAEVNVRTEYTYDANGNRLTIKDGNGRTTNFSYDELNRLVSESDPLGHTWIYSYDALGNRIGMIDANGVATSYNYDNASRLTNIVYGQSSNVSFSYDAAGRRISMTDGLGTTSWSYDDLNRATSITDPFGKTVGYSYDAAGNRTGLTYPDGQTVSYAYNAANRLMAVTGGQSSVISYQYDAVGRLLQVLRPNGVDSSYTYDDAGHLTQLAHALSGDTLSSFQYTYDPNGNRTQAVETMQSAALGPTVKVSVTETSGTPLAGVQVYAFSGDTYTGSSKVTDADGEASITLPAGNYRFRADVDGTQFWSSSSNHCTIGQCGQVTMTIPDPVLVSVQDSDGTPKEGLHVYAFDDTTYTNFSGLTDADGQVSLRLPNGNYRFRADYNGTPFWSADQNGCRVPLCTLVSMTVSVPVTVSVTDDLNMPLSGVQVYAFDGATYTNYHAATNSDGQAVLTLPSGNYRFRADFNGTQFWSSQQNNCAVPGCTSASVTVTTGVLVTVQDTDGSAKSGLNVYAFNGTTYTGYHGLSDSAGHVTFTLPQGDYRFRADLNGTQFWSSATNDCSVPGCGSASVTVTKPVTVTVQDTGGAVKSGLHVYAFNGMTYTNYNGTTDSNGQVALTLPQGDYRFRADLNDTQFWSGATNDCTLPGCESDEVVVTIPITVTVQDENGTPQGSVHVYAFTGTTYTGTQVITDTDGQAVFTLPQGSYRFRADLNGVQYWSSASNDCTIPGCTSDAVTVPTQPTATPAPSSTPTLTPGTGTPDTPTATPSPTATVIPSATPTASRTPTLTPETVTPDTPTPTPETPTQSGFQPGKLALASYWSASAFSNRPSEIYHLKSALQQSLTDVTVTVLDTDNAPQVGLNVYAFTGTTYTGTHGITDENGQAMLSLPDGSYRFRADLNGTQFWSSEQNDCSVPGCANNTVTVTIPVTVIVSDTGSSPKSGLSVYAFDGNTYTGYHQTTDSNGEASFTLPQGNYRFRADLNGTQFWSDTQNDCALPGCTSASVTVTLPVVVTVQDTDSAPKEGLNVYAFDGNTYTGYHQTTDSNGEASFTLPQGNYRFRADLNGTQFWSDTANDCALPGCTSDTVTITIPLTVTVMDGNGTPYPNLPVYAFDGDTYTGYHGATDSNGQAVFTLPQGAYRFRADYDGVQFWSSAENDCTLPGCTTDTVTLPGGMGQTTTTIDYSYDPLGRLTAADYSNGDFYHYAYDAVGNRLQQESTVNGLPSTVAYQYDIANRLTNVDGVDYTWDANGNLLSDGTNTYTYDFANRLSSFTNGTDSATYSYNGLGDRLQQTMDGVTTNYTLDLNAGLTQVLYDGTYAYTYGLGRISQQQGTTPEYFLSDALGSVRQLANAAGQVTLVKAYDPYGNVVASAGNGTSIYGYTGEIGDETGLSYLRARYYAAQHGRFISHDEWDGDEYQPLSFNHWNYTNDNPVNLTDPSGLITLDEADQAEQIAAELNRYGILVRRDWGYPIPYSDGYSDDPTSYPVWYNDPVDSSKSGIRIICNAWANGFWELSSLEAIRKGVENYVNTMGSSRVRNTFSGVTFYATYDDPAIGNRMYTYGHRDVWVPRAVMNDEPYIEHETVHELAHNWDNTCNDCLSKGMMGATKGRESGNTYEPGGQPPTKYAYTNREEDWAESVTAYFYPNYAQYPSWTTIRKDYVEGALDWVGSPPSRR